MARNDFHFVSRWRVEGTPEEVADTLSDAPDMPRWWPAVYREVRQLVPGDEHGVGKVVELRSKGWLPYTIRWRYRVTEANYPHSFTIEASGDFAGRGVWTLTGRDGWTDVTYDWRITSDRPLFKYGAFVIRPLFAFNHRWSMARGEESLRLELARRRARTPAERDAIPAPPGPTFASPRPFLLAAGASMGAGIAATARRGRSRAAARRKAVARGGQGVQFRSAGLLATAGLAGIGAALGFGWRRVGPPPAPPGTTAPPYLRGRPPLGVLRAFLRDPARYCTQAARDHGPVVGMQLGLFRTYVITHPDYARHVLEEHLENYEKDALTKTISIFLGEGLFVSDGETWRRNRRLVEPAYEPGRIAALGDTVTAVVERMLGRWHAAAEQGEPIDVAAEVKRLSLKLAVKTVFGADIGAEAATIEQALDTLVSWFDARMRQLIQPPPGLPLPANGRMRAAIEELDAIVYRAIGGHRQGAGKRASLLAILADLRTEDGQPVSDKLVRDEAMTALITIYQQLVALTWTLYAFARHRDAAIGVRREAVTLDGRRPTVGDLPALPYTGRFIDEALRLYPTNWGLVRATLRDDVIGGFHIPARSLVIINAYGLHHDPAYWPNPETFEADRFLPERSADRPSYAYQAFGSGPRRCIGQHFARMTIRLAVTMIAQRFDLHLLPDRPVEPQTVIALIQPRDGVIVRLTEERGSAAAEDMATRVAGTIVS